MFENIAPFSVPIISLNTSALAETLFLAYLILD